METEHAQHPVVRRLRRQRSIAGILGIALLGYALLVPMADAKLIGMNHVEAPAATDKAPCHMANGNMSPTHDTEPSPCCQVDRCNCAMLSAAVALPSVRVTPEIPIHGPVRSFVSSLHPYTLVELPLRPPDT